MTKFKLTNEEKKIAQAYDKGEFKPVQNNKEKTQQFVSMARNTLNKDQRLNIRITSHDLQGLQQKALEEGLPYQTFVASILHKFVTGKLRPI